MRFLLFFLFPILVNASANNAGLTYSHFDQVVTQALQGRGFETPLTTVSGLMDVLVNSQSTDLKTEAYKNLSQFVYEGRYSQRSQNQILDSLLNAKGSLDRVNLKLILTPFSHTRFITLSVLTKLEMLLQRPNLSPENYLWIALPILKHTKNTQLIENKIIPWAKNKGPVKVRVLSAVALLLTRQAPLARQILLKIIKKDPEGRYSLVEMTINGVPPYDDRSSDVIMALLKKIGVVSSEGEYIRMSLLRNAPPHFTQSIYCGIGMGQLI